MEEEREFLARLKTDPDGEITRVYDAYRADFIRFANRYAVASEDVLDVYQDAIIVLFEHARLGKLEGLKSSVKTYLFGVGKYMLLKRLKKSGTQPFTDDRILDMPDEVYDETLHQERVGAIQLGLAHLGEQCRKILRLFYYEGKSLDEIQAMMGYTNKDVLKSQKSRCLKQLKDLTKRNGHG